MISRILALALTLALAQAPGARADPPAAPAGWIESPMRIEGRIAERGGNRLHQWPGIRAEANIAGEAAILALSASPARYRVTVGAGSTKPRVLMIERPEHGVRDLPLDGAGPHRVVIESLGETLGAPGALPRLLVPAAEAIQPPLPAPTRRIEVIGDSDSTGHGVLHVGRDCDGPTTERTSDSTAAWPSLLARKLGAELRLHAASGIGLVRNFGGAEPARTLPALYHRTLWPPLPDAPGSEAGERWQPQLIVVAIGSNDFDSPLQATEKWDSPRAVARDFTPALVDLLAELRERSPSARILLAVWPEYGRPYMRAQRDALAQRVAAGDDAIAMISLPRMEKTACGWHPSLADHATIAAAIEASLAAAGRSPFDCIAATTVPQLPAPATALANRQSRFRRTY